MNTPEDAKQIAIRALEDINVTNAHAGHLLDCIYDYVMARATGSAAQPAQRAAPSPQNKILKKLLPVVVKGISQAATAKRKQLGGSGVSYFVVVLFAVAVRL